LKHFDRFPMERICSSGMWRHFTVDEAAGFACGTHPFEVELQAQAEMARVRPTRLRCCPKRLQAFAVFRVCKGSGFPIHCASASSFPAACRCVSASAAPVTVLPHDWKLNKTARM